MLLCFLFPFVNDQNDLILTALNSYAVKLRSWEVMRQGSNLKWLVWDLVFKWRLGKAYYIIWECVLGFHVNAEQGLHVGWTVSTFVTWPNSGDLIVWIPMNTTKLWLANFSKNTLLKRKKKEKKYVRVAILLACSRLWDGRENWKYSIRPLPVSFFSTTSAPSSRPYELRAWNTPQFDPFYRAPRVCNYH